MAKGKLLFITDKKIHTTIEFDGDIYPEGSDGETIIEAFTHGCLNNFSEFVKFIEEFNENKYGYKEELIYPSKLKSSIIDVTDNKTNYLYIINNLNIPCTVKAKNGDWEIASQCLGVVYYSTFEGVAKKK